MTTDMLMDGLSGRPGTGPGLTATSGGWLLGAVFSVTGQMMWLNSYRHWVPTGGDTAARKFALWNITGNSTQNLVSGGTMTSGVMTAGAWNQADLASPVQLAPGGLYMAVVGWTVTNGIPNTTAQFEASQPYASGITNGPLTLWSGTAGSSEWTDGTTANYSRDQMMYSNSLGADPAAALPATPSSGDNFWVDVIVSDTAPTGYPGSYRLRPNRGDYGNYSLDTANNFTLGLEFSLSQACTVSNIWFYSPATVTQLPTAIGVYRVSDQALVANTSSPSWSGAAGSGWISAPLTGSLASGTKYKIAVLNGAGTPSAWNAAIANYWSTGFGGSGLTAGPITAYANAAADAPGQATYNAGATLAYPNTNVGPYDYGLDIEVIPASAPGPQYAWTMRRMP